MTYGSALVLFGFDVQLFQGMVSHLYEGSPAFQVIEGEDGAYRLELDVPRIETRTDGDYRLGVHLTGELFLGDDPEPRVFDAWVRLRPEVVEDEDGLPVGALRFDAVEEVVPALAKANVAAAFGPEGPIGEVLESFDVPVFEDLLESVNGQLFPGAELDASRFSTRFYLGRSAPMRRPVWGVERANGDWDPALEIDVAYATVPALVAAVGLAADDPTPPGEPSIVRPGTGLGLVSTKALFDARLALESAAAIGQEMSGLTIERLEIASTDYGFDLDGRGRKTGAVVEFSGELIAMFLGGAGGQLTMRSTVVTDVDTAWWVDLLGVVAAIVPVVGWVLGEVFIWGPESEAPEKVENALLDRFAKPLDSAAAKLASGFGIPDIPTKAVLADAWFFDGNMGVAAAAFAGRSTAEVKSVERDIAYLARDPTGEGRRSNRRRPVTSVGEIVLSSGHVLKPWQAADLVRSGILEIPGHHAVENPLATGGLYLRSNPDDLTSNNLLG